MDTKAGFEMAREMGIAHPGPATLHILERGSVAEAIAGGAAVILAILGLIGLLPLTLCAIGIIAVGVAMLLGGAAVVARHREFTGTASGPRAVANSMELVAFGGVGAVVLGILALLRVIPYTLLPIAALLSGATLVVVSSVIGRLDALIQRQRQAPTTDRTEQAVRGASGFDTIVGIGAIVLGILGLSGNNPVTLTLVVALAVGVAVLLSGSSLAARIYRVFG
ncbi:MAG TPA: hypothetical protein VKG23_04690 [Thermoanaerobaculia bacterium]|jgi:hypothetical protein|nr:hypothetical protein [Thermoanaerobaculia bacterium]